jgi:hypothetical protein
MFQLARGPRRRVFGSLATADEPCDAVQEEVECKSEACVELTLELFDTQGLFVVEDA